MKRFVFNLESLLRVRYSKEVRLQKELGIQNECLSKIKEETSSLEKELSALSEEIDKKREANDRSFEEMYVQIYTYLKNLLQECLLKENAQQKIVEELKNLVIAVSCNRKLIEKIKENEYSNWRIHTLYEEDQELDEYNCRKV